MCADWQSEAIRRKVARKEGGGRRPVRWQSEAIRGTQRQSEGRSPVRKEAVDGPSDGWPWKGSGRDEKAREGIRWKADGRPTEGRGRPMEGHGRWRGRLTALPTSGSTSTWTCKREALITARGVSRHLGCACASWLRVCSRQERARMHSSARVQNNASGVVLPSACCSSR